MDFITIKDDKWNNQLTWPIQTSEVKKNRLNSTENLHVLKCYILGIMILGAIFLGP